MTRQKASYFICYIISKNSKNYKKSGQLYKYHNHKNGKSGSIKRAQVSKTRLITMDYTIQYCN